MTFRITSKRAVSWTFALPALVALFTVPSCGEEDCSESQTCKGSSGKGGAAGANTGGTSGAGGSNGGVSGTGGGGRGGSGGSGTAGAGTGGSDAPGGDGGTGGEGDAGGSDAGGSDTGGIGGAGAGGAGRGGIGGAGAGGAGAGGKGGAGAGGAGAGGAGAGGAGAGGAGAGGAGMGGTGGDRTAPTVLSISPADGATGVTSSANVVITFSEPMDTQATEAAYQSAEIPTSAAAVSWNAARTVLTIDPTAPLTYATGTNPSATQARNHAITIGTGARDDAGNNLASAFSSSFRTQRRITHTLRPVPFTSGTGYWAYYRAPDPLMNYGTCADGLSIRVGCHPSPFNYAVIVAYDITSVPAGVTDFESAVVSANQIAGMGDPIGRSGLIALRHIPPVPVNTGVSLMPIGGAALHDLGVFSTNLNPGLRSLDALRGLEDDYENRQARSNMSTYRIEHLSNQGGGPYVDAWVNYECSSFALTTTYVVP